MLGSDPIREAFDGPATADTDLTLRLLGQTAPWLVVGALACLIVAVALAVSFTGQLGAWFVAANLIAAAALLLRHVWAIRLLRARGGPEALEGVMRAYRQLWVLVAWGVVASFLSPCVVMQSS